MPASVRRLLLTVTCLLTAGFLFSMWLRPESSGGLPPGSVAPPIEADGWLIGEPPSMADLHGQVVVVIAWAHWCRPCREEAPHLVQLHERFRDHGVVFIGLTAEPAEANDHSLRFLKSADITWSNGFGAKRTLDAFQTFGLPSAWVIGRDGKVVWNFDSRQELEDAIAAALNSKG